MMITVEEFKEMGFFCDDEELASNCIKRAEYVLNGLSGGRAVFVSQTKGTAADYVKQACAFQANAIMREEKSLREQSENNAESSGVEKVSIGDFSYSYSSSDKSGNSDYEPLDTDLTVIRLLRAAGCLYLGTEVYE